MPDLKISQLPAASTPLAGTELVPIVQGGTTDQTTVQAILTSAVPSGTANGVLFLNGSKVVTSGSGLTFDTSGNLGLGVTPSAWNSSAKALQIPYGAFWNVSDGVYLGTNYFLNSSAQRIYAYTGKFALEYLQYALDGSHRWYTAPSGTAGNAISFTQAMTLDASGNLGIGTSSPSQALEVYSATAGIVQVRGGSGSNQGGSFFVRNAANTETFCAFGDRARALGGTPDQLVSIYTAGGKALTFDVAAAERLRLKSTGQLRFVPLAADPAGAENGDVYYNSGTNKLRLYAAGAWVDLN